MKSIAIGFRQIRYAKALKRTWLDVQRQAFPQYTRNVLQNMSTHPKPNHPGAKVIERAVSSLRIDTIASAGLNVSRNMIWEACLEGRLRLNSLVVEKKSSKVKEGDVVELDQERTVRLIASKTQSKEDTEAVLDADLVTRTRRSRVDVVAIGPPTKKGGSHITLRRIKEFCYLLKS